jgi:archaellum component FlaD/FlaE
MNYAQEQRLRFIDFLLSQYGYINRSAVMDYYSISTPQASRDFKVYMQLAPENMEYSKTDKIYKRTNKFIRVWP